MKMFCINNFPNIFLDSSPFHSSLPYTLWAPNTWTSLIHPWQRIVQMWYIWREGLQLSTNHQISSWWCCTNHAENWSFILWHVCWFCWSFPWRIALFGWLLWCKFSFWFLDFSWFLLILILNLNKWKIHFRWD